MSDEEEKRIYAELKAERTERIEGIAGVHQRLDELFTAVNRIGKPNGGDWRTVAGMVAIAGLIVTMLTLHINFVSTGVTDAKNLAFGHTQIKGHPGVLEEIAAVNEKFAEVETQFGALKEVTGKDDYRSSERLDKIEEWQKWWYRTTQPKDATQDEQLRALNQRMMIEDNDGRDP